MIRFAKLLILPVLLSGCSTHFSTLQPDGSSEQVIYAVPEEQAFQIAHGTLAATLPGRKIDVIDGPVRGYSTYFRFLLDTYTQQVLVHAAQGTDVLGKKVQGYYFEVSGSGSSFVQGRAKNVELFERLNESAKATGKGTAVTAVERIAYTNAKWRLGEGELVRSASPGTGGNKNDDLLDSLERLKGLRDRGVITDVEFESKKKEILNRL